MSDLPPTRCPECHHDINWHGYEFDFDRYMCGGTYGDCDCGLSPSDIARALLTADPSAEEVERAARAIWDGWSISTAWGDLSDDGRNAARREAHAVLRAAREARA